MHLERPYRSGGSAFSELFQRWLFDRCSERGSYRPGVQDSMLSGVYFLYDCACAILLAARMKNALTHRLNTGVHTRVGV